MHIAETVRIEPTAHVALREIARECHLSLTEALTRAIEAYRRELFLAGVASDFAALRADKDAWAEERAEQALWDQTSGDGLEDE